MEKKNMKMTITSKIEWKNSGVEVIDDSEVNSIYFWINERHIETKIGHSTLPVVTKKLYPEYKKRKSELVDNSRHQQFRSFICNNLAERLLKIFRADEIDAFKRSLGSNLIDAFNAKKQAITKKIKNHLKEKIFKLNIVS